MAIWQRDTMNTEIVTPQQARQIARRLFLKLYPDQEDWFDLAWDCYTKVGSQPGTKFALARVPGLGVEGGPGSITENIVNHFVSFAAAFLIQHPIAVGLLNKRYLKEKKNVPAPLSDADFSDVTAGVLREEPQSVSVSPALGSKEKFADDIIGCGKLTIEAKAGQLYLPAQLCRVLGDRLKADWLIFKLNRKRLIAFPACLRNLFFQRAKDEYQFNEETISDFQGLCWEITRIVREKTKKRKKYKTVTWVLPTQLILQLEFPENDPLYLPSKKSFSCEISPRKFWLQISLI